MSKAELLKKQIDLLPPSMLNEVERLVKELKKQGKTIEKTGKSLRNLAAYAIEDDLPTDLAEQHDHYLYGTPKK